MVLPNQSFGEQVLVAAGMSDKWPQDSENVSLLLLERQEVALYHQAFPAHVGVMSVRPLCVAEEYWAEQIRPNFMHVRADLFAAPPVVTKGVYIPNPKPCRAITHAGKEVVYLSSEDSVASSEHELNPHHDVFAGVLRSLGINHEEKKPKRVSKKKVTVAEGVAIKK
ncbi:hypothetical protein Hanom_Chr14g01301521 [Helianthus anomalus]